MDKKKDVKIIRIRAELVFLVTLLLVFGCTFLVNQNQQRREKLKAAYTAESTISRIEVQLNRYLAESNLVKKSIEEGLTISDKQFATLSRLMQDEDDIIKVHEIAKDGIVSQIYPMEGNEDVIGLNMIKEAWQESRESECENCGNKTLTLPTILMQAVATSIDALAVGISFAVIHVNIFTACLLICGITFGLSLIGAAMGKRFGSMVKEKARVLGGVILILIGLRIFVEHMFF